MLAAEFYVTVMRELIVAIGAALVLANAWAIIRSRIMPRSSAELRATRSAAASAKRKSQTAERAGRAADGTLVRAPLSRTIPFMLLGVFMLIWGIASLATST
jgi:L-lactate permease